MEDAKEPGPAAIERDTEDRDHWPRITVFDPPIEMLQCIGDFSKFHNPFRAFYAMEIIRKLNLPIKRIKPFLCGEADICQYHTVPYIAGLKIQGKSKRYRSRNSKDFGIVQDLYDYYRLCTTGSLGCAFDIVKDRIDFGVNFYGGASFAQRQRTCFDQAINDTILSILVFSQKFNKILYISLDDCLSAVVEEAFYSTDKVFTLSFFHRREASQFDKVVQTDIESDIKGKSFKRVGLIDHLMNEEFFQFATRIIDRVLLEVEPEVVVFQMSSRLLASDVTCPSNLMVSDVYKLTSHVVSRVSEKKCKLLLLGGTGYSIADTARMYAAQYLALSGNPDYEKILEKDIQGLESHDYFKENPSLKTTLGNLVECKGEEFISKQIDSCFDEKVTAN